MVLHLSTAGQAAAGPAAPGAFHRLAQAAPRGRAPRLRIALVNNMPDAALHRTVRQFASLFAEAAGDMAVDMSCHALPSVPRATEVRWHIEATYAPMAQLWSDPPDALVVTGTEPHAQDLRDEPYWKELTGLFDWAALHRIPAMLSCLAAHAAVLHADGVPRRPLEAKRFGVYRHDVAAGQPLTAGCAPRVWLPHTRWNDLDEAALAAAGYTMLARSPEAGAGLFAKERGGTWLYCQAHPEYDHPNLMREYRRDVQRFMRGERPAYPEMPEWYFGPRDIVALAAFRASVLARRKDRQRLMAEFPRVLEEGAHGDLWRDAAVRLVGNWLDLVAAGSGAEVPARRLVR